MSERKRVVIMGAGGRDFHVFNTCYREDEASEVVAFTATQIPGIDKRTYPSVLAGPHYPDGIPIVPEEELEQLVERERVDEVVFAYSDVSFDYVKGIEERVGKTRAAFSLFDADRTMLPSSKPVVAVTAVRTGVGKSSVSRHVAATLKSMGRTVAALRHPMPYGNLEKQVVQRFASIGDLEKHDCTIEEMEEYEPHIAAGNVVFAGADYARILAEAEKEADVIIWDGGNNDTSFLKPDLWITLVDPLRPGHEVDYFPGRWNLERADIVVINKIDQAAPDDLATVRANIARHAPDARVVEGRSPFVLDDPAAVRGKRVVVVEDGPTVTHGGMGYGAGYLAAQEAGAAEIVDPRPFVEGDMAGAFAKYTHLAKVLPALGYGRKQLDDLAETIRRVDCDAVVIGTPIDLGRVLDLDKPAVRVTYRFEEASDPGLADLLRERLG